MKQRLKEPLAPAMARVEAFARLRWQMIDLEWLLAKSGWTEGRWKARLTVERQGGLTLGLVLQHRELGCVRVSSVPDPEESAKAGVGSRHYWIDGNHWYDEHAVGVLQDALGASSAVEELCRAAEDVMSRVETGEVDRLHRALSKVRRKFGLVEQEG